MTGLAPRLGTLAVAALGTLAFWALDLPLPFLFGPMFACLAAALLRLPLAGLGKVSIAARTVLGIAVGASLTPAVVAVLPTMALSLLLVPLYVAVIAAVGTWFFRRLRFDPVTSYYAAMPGGLQDMVIFGSEAGGDPRALSLIQATRVLLIVTLAPLILSVGFGASLDAPIGAPAAALPVAQMALMAAAGAVGWWIAAKVGLFGASILGPLIAAGALSLAGVLEHRPPAEAILAAQFLIGIGIGVGYLGVTPAEVRRDVAAGVGFVLVLAVLTVAFAEAVVWLTGAPHLEAFLAFAPGGQAEMTIIAILVGADLGFVVVHHLVRLAVVITCAPLFAGRGTK
nr:AbrB family transcriptional regulator [Jannaschia sp. Os4]